MNETWSATWGECEFNDEEGRWYWVSPDGQIVIPIPDKEEL